MMITMMALLASASALAVPGGPAHRAAMELQWVRAVKLSSRAKSVSAPFRHRVEDDEVAWQEMGFVNEVSMRKRTQEHVVPLFRNTPKQQPREEIIAVSPTTVLVRPTFPDLSDSVDSIMGGQRKKRQPRRETVVDDVVLTRKRA